MCMFGRRNKKEEHIRNVFDYIYQQRVTFETSVGQVEEGRERVHKDLEQVVTNTTDMVNHAMNNIEEASALIHDIDEFSKVLSGGLDEFGQFKKEIQEQLQAASELIEGNKHLTTPSKYLSEVPNSMKETYESYEQHLDDMVGYGKQMGVLALNAAIEAGRLGEGGRSFMMAAEEIRQTAVSYEKAAEDMKAEVAASHEKIEELEETISHLIALLRENTIGAAKLFKKCQETKNSMEQKGMRDYSDDLISIRGRVVNIRNLDEEIAKCGERNQIQLSDIQEDIQSQKQEITEMESDLLHLLDVAEEQFR